MSQDQPPRRMNSIEDRNAIIESALEAAIRRGDFDDLPGLGKPLTGLHNSEDPDWWIKQKMDQEGISGVAPAAFQLRKENAVLEDTLDAFSKEAEVRAYLAGFNDRVRAAVMDLRDGPPVFTPPRKIELEVTAWRQRRTTNSTVKTSTTTTGEAETNPAPASTDGQGQGWEQPRRWWRRKRG